MSGLEVNTRVCCNAGGGEHWRAGCGGRVLSALLIERRHLAGKRAHPFSSSLSQACRAFSESPARPGCGSTRRLFYEFPLGQGCGLPEVLISRERNINLVCCNLFAYKPECLSIPNNQHMAIKQCQDSSKPHREKALSDVFSACWEEINDFISRRWLLGPLR